MAGSSVGEAIEYSSTLLLARSRAIERVKDSGVTRRNEARQPRAHEAHEAFLVHAINAEFAEHAEVF
jgi:hypothetical protein